MSRAPVPSDRGVARLGLNHAAVARLRRLSTDGRTRRAEGVFVVEGPAAVAEAIEAGVEVEAVYVEGEHPTLDLGGQAVHHVADDVLRRATDAVTSQGVAAIVRRPARSLADVPAGSAVLVLVGLADPGNAGTLVRSAEAAAIGAVLFTAGSVDPWSPKAVRASAGSVLRVPVISGGEAGVVLEDVRATGRERVGTRAADAPALADAPLPPDVALVLGNEAHGIPSDLDHHLDRWVRIPMAGRVESLNVAMAGTLLCYEVARRRGALA
jgi:TrmH family RNA methyltransferase